VWAKFSPLDIEGLGVSSHARCYSGLGDIFVLF